MTTTQTEIPINPPLRRDFDITPNDERPQEEIEQWWSVPYIVTTTWEQHRADASYDDFIERMASYGGMAGYVPLTRQQWEQEQEEQRLDWFTWFPDGIRYEVRCLDGGCWDRSTTWGVFATLGEAINCANTGPDWLRQSPKSEASPFF